MTLTITSPKHGTHEVLFDDVDASIVQGKRWYLHHLGQHLYVRESLSKTTLHRFIMADKLKPGRVVDHINRDTLDNRRSNLRVVTIQQNLRNQRRPENTTGVTGVTLHACGKYQAQIKTDYKGKYLGLFDTIEEAAAARKAAERELWGIAA